MIRIRAFIYTPAEHESEKASNSYLMSLVAMIAGMPLPIVNLAATVGFYVSQRNSEYFIRWHCIQALFAQLLLFCMNIVAFYWSISILFGSLSITNLYLSYLATVFLFNLIELGLTIFSAINTGKGRHVEWWFLGPLTDRICRR